jgi:hypothetical protein
MAFTDFGLAKGLAVVPDWQGMTQQASKDFMLENEMIRQKKDDVSKEAAQMELGQTFDTYNKTRYNTYLEGVYKELADFDMKNPNYAFAPQRKAERDAIIFKIKNNEILQDSETTKKESEALYDFIKQNPGSERNPEIIAQLSELSTIREKGNAVGGISQGGFRFKKPAVRDLRTEIKSYLIPQSIKKSIQHENGMIYSETSLNDATLQKQANLFLMNHENASLVNTYYAGLTDDEKTLYGRSPMNMLLTLTRSAFVPEKSDAVQYRNYGASTRSGSIKTPEEIADKAAEKAEKEAATTVTADPYKAWIESGSFTQGNKDMRAFAFSSFDKNGEQFVENKVGDNYSIMYLNDKGVKMNFVQTPSRIKIVSGDGLDDRYYKNGKGARLVTGVAEWDEPLSVEDAKIKYDDSNFEFKAINDYSCTVTLKNARFLSNRNPQTFNENVYRLGTKEIGNGSVPPPSPNPAFKFVAKSKDGHYYYMDDKNNTINEKGQIINY